MLRMPPGETRAVFFRGIGFSLRHFFVFGGKSTMHILDLAKNKYKCFRRRLFLAKAKKHLKNKNFSLVASNCNGAAILHDLGLPFQSPFVNLWIKPQDFIKMLQSLEKYLEAELCFINEDGISYPVAMLDDVKIYFQHYETEEDAREKWNKRKSRMDYDNLFVLFSDRDGCTEEDLIRFDNLPYIHKAVFVNRPYERIKSAVYIRGFENEDSVGICMDYRKGFSYRKYYDDFDYVGWFNS